MCWQAPTGLSSVLASTLYLVDVAARMRLTAVGQVAAIVPFVSREKRHMTLYKGEAALAARRDVADTVNTKELGGTGAALEGLWAHLLEHAGEAAAATPAA